MNIKLLTEQHLGLKGGCTGSSESIHVKMPHCWKALVAAQIRFNSLKKANKVYFVRQRLSILVLEHTVSQVLRKNKD